MIGHSFFAVVMTFLSVSPAIIYLLAGYLILGGGSGGISAGVVIAFTTLQTRLYFPIGRLLEVSVELQSSMALFDRIFGYLDLNQEIVDAPDAIALSPSSISGAIRYDSVRVRYSPTAEERLDDDQPEDNQRWAVDGVNLEVLPGQMAAFVGPSGAGKTTLAYLIPRLYDATEGSVRIDGTDVQRIRLDSLAGLVGFVTQESFLFHSSLRDNLLYAKPDATQREIEEAAKAAYIHDRIMGVPRRIRYGSWRAGL